MVASSGGLGIHMKVVFFSGERTEGRGLDRGVGVPAGFNGAPDELSLDLVAPRPGHRKFNVDSQTPHPIVHAAMADYLQFSWRRARALQVPRESREQFSLDVTCTCTRMINIYYLTCNSELKRHT